MIGLLLGWEMRLPSDDGRLHRDFVQNKNHNKTGGNKKKGGAKESKITGYGKAEDFYGICSTKNLKFRRRHHPLQLQKESLNNIGGSSANFGM
jgi:hypothetical protein